jgi:hypothetical protein
MINVSLDPQVMKSVINDMVKQLASKIDKDYVQTVCKEQYGIETITGIEHKDGDVVVIKDGVACKLDFEVRFPMSVYITNGENPTRTLSENHDEESDLEDIQFTDELKELDEDIVELEDIAAGEDDDVSLLQA